MLGTTTKSSGAEKNDAPKGDQAGTGFVHFVRASDENLQPAFDQQRTVNANMQDLGVQDIPAYGFISHLYVMVEATGAANGLATVDDDEDGPWTSLQNIALTEPNGAFIVQFNDGYQMYLANKYGGYLHPAAADPKRSPMFSAINTAGNFSFILRVPVAVSSRDAVGSLPNQDSAGQFKFRVSVAPSSTIYDTAPNTLPTMRIRAWLGAYDQPEPQSAGMANQVEPPAVGTTSLWSVQAGVTVNNGQNNIELKRKGNYLRQLIFVFRSSGTRATGQANWPDQTIFMRDAFPARYYEDKIWRHIMFERTGYTGTIETSGGLDNGVRFHDYMHEFDTALGRELRDQWQPSRGSTRLELTGSFKAAGTLDIITNDVTVANNVFL
jgi:hypothetical protein